MIWGLNGFGTFVKSGDFSCFYKTKYFEWQLGASEKNKSFLF